MPHAGPAGVGLVFVALTILVLALLGGASTWMPLGVVLLLVGLGILAPWNAKRRWF